MRRAEKIGLFIVESLAYSMGAEKRKELIEELEQYKLGLPFDIR